MSTEEVLGGKRSAWMSHVKKTMRAHKGMKLGAVLKMASKTFKKARRGGGGPITAMPVSGEDSGSVPPGTAPATGGRRRGSRKSRSRGSRKSRGTRKH